MQEKHNSIASALELRLSCTNPSICSLPEVKFLTLFQGGTSVEAYFPDDTWYDFYTGKKMEVRGQWTKLDAPLGKINVHMRGYSVRITQPSEVTTAQA